MIRALAILTLAIAFLSAPSFAKAPHKHTGKGLHQKHRQALVVRGEGEGEAEAQERKDPARGGGALRAAGDAAPVDRYDA